MKVLQECKNWNQNVRLMVQRCFINSPVGKSTPMDTKNKDENVVDNGNGTAKEASDADASVKNGVVPRKRARKKDSRWDDENEKEEKRGGSDSRSRTGKKEDLRLREGERVRERRSEPRRSRSRSRDKGRRLRRRSRSRSSDRRRRPRSRSRSRSVDRNRRNDSPPLVTPSGSKTTRKRSQRRQRQRAARFVSHSRYNNNDDYQPYDDYRPYDDEYQPYDDEYQPYDNDNRFVTPQQWNGSINNFDPTPPVWLPSCEPVHNINSTNPPMCDVQAQPAMSINNNNNGGLDVSTIVQNMDKLWPSWKTLASFELGLLNSQTKAPPVQSLPNIPESPSPALRPPRIPTPLSRRLDLERRRREAGRVLPSAAMFTNCETLLGSAIQGGRSRPRLAEQPREPSPSPPPPPSPPPFVAKQPLEPISALEEARMEIPPEIPPTKEAVKTWDESTQNVVDSWNDLLTAEPRVVPPQQLELREEPPWPAEKKLDDPHAIPLIEPELYEPSDPRKRTEVKLEEGGSTKPLCLPLPRFSKKLPKGWEDGPFEWGAIEPTVWPEEFLMQQQANSQPQNSGNSKKKHKKDSKTVSNALNPDAMQRVLSSEDVQHALDSPNVRQALDSSSTIQKPSEPGISNSKPSPLSINPDLIQQALSSPKIQKALDSPTLQQALTSEIVKSPIFSTQQSVNLNSEKPNFGHNMPLTVNTNVVQQALNSPIINNSFNSPTLQQALNLHSINQALNLDLLHKALNSPAVQQALNSPTIQDVLNSQQGSSETLNYLPTTKQESQITQNTLDLQDEQIFKRPLSPNSALNLQAAIEQQTSPYYTSPIPEEQMSPIPMEISTPPQETTSPETVKPKRKARKTFSKVCGRPQLSFGELRILAELKKTNRELRNQIREALVIDENAYLLLPTNLKLDSSDEEVES